MGLSCCGNSLKAQRSWKSLIYFLAALLVRYLNHVVPLLTKHESLMAANRHLVAEMVWPQVWLI
ncbi:MAG: hypothetical protein HY881_28605 [Deltaproteobacteria bacterium]|nr:hypothetical protein [Deltaproteobacteria bacterium]